MPFDIGRGVSKEQPPCLHSCDLQPFPSGAPSASYSPLQTVRLAVTVEFDAFTLLQTHPFSSDDTADELQIVTCASQHLHCSHPLFSTPRLVAKVPPRLSFNDTPSPTISLSNSSAGHILSPRLSPVQNPASFLKPLGSIDYSLKPSSTTLALTTFTDCFLRHCHYYHLTAPPLESLLLHHLLP